MKHLITLLLVVSAPVLAASTADTVQNPFDGKTTKVTKAAKRTNPSASCGSYPRTCGQMTSCEQAKRALACGNTRLDRDKDGVPCETICR